MAETNSTPKPSIVLSSCTSCECSARDQAAAMAHQVGACPVTERAFRLVLIQQIGLWELAGH